MQVLQQFLSFYPLFPILCPAHIDYRSVHGTLLDKARGEPIHRCYESATLTTQPPTHLCLSHSSDFNSQNPTQFFVVFIIGR
jgi:hypothetical protein